MKTKTTHTLRKLTGRLAALLAVAAVPSAFAASQTWSNAPVSANWNVAANWNANAVPGGLNLTGNTVNNDTATFNSPLFGGIGGDSNPILTDDATSTSRARQIGSIVFDTANVGAYVISNATMLTPTSSNGVLYVSHNGSIQMNAAVTNSQTILVPVISRSPSSTDVVYNFVNNSTTPSAILYISAATNGMGTSRNTRWTLGGSNTGTNTVAALSRGAYTAGTPSTGGGIRKQGTGTWVLTGPNDQLANVGTVVAVNEGMLVAQHNSVFGLCANVTVTSNGVLRLDGVTLDQTFVNLALNGTIRMNGSASLNGVAVSAAVTGISPTLATTSASDVFTVGTGLVAASIVSGGAADSVLNTAGPGTLVFGQANTYIGKWSFNAKTNQITNPSALGTGANANVGAGAIFDLTPQGAVTFVPTTTGFGGSGTGATVGTTAAAVVADAGATLDLSTKNINLTFTPTSFSGDLTHPALTMAQGTLAIGGNTFFINNASGTPLGVGTYRLIEQTSGSITSGGGYAALISGSGMVGGGAAAIVVSGGNVDLVVSIYTPKDLVWSGTGADWDVNSTANWLDGVTASVFNSSDNVTFNGTGIANPSVNLLGTLAPASVVVDTSAGDYTFGGAGQIAGTTSLIKNSAGTLNLNTVNTYAGGTVVSNGTVRIGANNAISSTGAGDVAVYGSSVIDLNGFNNTLNALLGNGTVDVQSGGASVLTVGNNDDTGIFSGVLKNTSGTLGLVKIGTGNVTLTASNSYSGTTTVNAGTLTVANQNALGVGDLAVNAGAVNLQTGVTLNSLAGTGGGIANNANTSTNNIRIAGSTTTTYGGNVTDGTGGGGVSLTLLGGTLSMAGNNTYSGGTYVGSGATFNIPNSPAAVGGFLIASNGATVGLTGGSGTPGTPNSVTTVDGALATFTGGAEGKLWQCQWNGGVNSTNFYSGPCSFNQPMSFSNFLGRVQFSTTTANFRFNNALSGGDNTTFEFILGNVHINAAQTVRLGEIVGGSGASGITGGAGAGTWIIGTKNTSTTFQGYIKENGGATVNLVKSGTGSLTLNGAAYYTNTVTLPDPFEPTNIVNFALSSNVITYIGATTVSNGTLKIVAPNHLTNSSAITLAGGTLDATQIGYATNQTTLDYNLVEQATNTVAVMTGTLDILDGKTLSGTGSILGSVNAQAGSTVTVGLGLGTMAVSGSVALNGTVNMDLNRSNLAQNSDRLTAASFSGSGAVLNVTNVGPTLLSGTVFQLFNGPVAAFTTVNLPATDASGQIAYTWQNNLAVNGSITLVTGLNPSPAPLSSVLTGSTLNLSWPLDHLGWTLQVQTNSLAVGISTNWSAVAGSTATNQVFVPVVPGNPSVFYRLTLPLP